MPEYRRHRPRAWPERGYRLLLRLYPREFRDEFGDAMAEFFADRLTRAGRRARITVCARALADVIRHAPAARLDAVARRWAARVEERRVARGSPFLRRSRQEEWMLSSIGQDARYALRGIRREPAFSATVMATLALGIGGTVAIFSVVHGVLLRPLPYADAQAIVHMVHQPPSHTVSEPEFVDYRRDLRSAERIAAYRTGAVTLSSEAAEPERVEVAAVSEEFFRIMGLPPLLGRPFSADEDKRGGPDVVIMSERLWRRRYGADTALVGRPVSVNGRPRTVVGILPASFTFPSPDVVLWSPLRLNYDTLWTRNNHYLQMVGRLARGASAATVALEMSEMGRRLSRDFPAFYPAGQPLVGAVTLLPDLVLARTRPFLVALFGAVAFVLLIACVNVANLLLARGESRRKEVAIRTAMGASRTRVARQAFTESLIHALSGGVLGVLVAAVGVRALIAMAPADVPRLGEVALNAPVLAFALGLSLLTGVVFGLVPALRAPGTDVTEALKEGGKTSSSRARRQGRLRRALVGAEVALAVVTLSGAGLMLRSLWNLQRTDLGFRPDHVLTARVAPPATVYTDARATQFWDALLARVGTLPDVEAAAAVEDLPVADGNSDWSILIDDAPMTSVANAPSAMPQKVTSRYFDVMRIPVIEGRTFTEADRPDAPLVVVVNATMARMHWPGRSAIGRRVRMLSTETAAATVVGVVADVRSGGFRSDVPPTMYFPQSQAARSAYYVPSAMSLVVRTRGAPAAVVPAVRRLVRELEQQAPVSRVRTMDQLLAESVAPRRFTTRLLAGFAVVALALAGLGLYGVVAYLVNQRRYEIGLRMALGASRRQVLGRVLLEGLRMSALGAAVGLASAIAVARVIRALFVDVTMWDPLTLGSVVLLLLVVAVAASYVPARRAGSVDPMTALRAE
jgi:predicted permease